MSTLNNWVHCLFESTMAKNTPQHFLSGKINVDKQDLSWDYEVSENEIHIVIRPKSKYGEMAFADMYAREVKEVLGDDPAASSPPPPPPGATPAAQQYAKVIPIKKDVTDV